MGPRHARRRASRVLLVHHVANLGALVALAARSRCAPPCRWARRVGTACSRRSTASSARRRRSSQHRLTAQLARFRSAAQAMPDGVIVLDGDDHIVWCNATAERYFGLDARRDAGQPILNLVRHPDFVDYLQARRVRRAVHAAPARGEELVLSLRIVPYGQDEKLLLVARRHAGRERLETMRRDFVANVSHELKTPLTVVSGFLETIADGNVPLDEPRGRQVLGLMRSQTRPDAAADRGPAHALGARVERAAGARDARSTSQPLLRRDRRGGARALGRTAHGSCSSSGRRRRCGATSTSCAARSRTWSRTRCATRRRDGRITLAWAEHDGEGCDRGRGHRHRHRAASHSAAHRALLSRRHQPLARHRRHRARTRDRQARADAPPGARSR